MIGGRLHNIRSNFIFIIIITTVGVRVGVVDDDLVFRTDVLRRVVISTWCGVSHEHS